MEDLSAATFEDVARFFRTYYVPNNASLVVAGDIDIARTKQLVEKWFADVPRGKDVIPLAPTAVQLDSVKQKTITDKVQLPRLYLAWHTPPLLKPGDATMDMIAERVERRQELAALSASGLRPADRAGRQRVSSVAGARQQFPDHRHRATGPYARRAEDRHRRRDSTSCGRRRPNAREVTRALNQYEANFYRQMERVGGFGGKANQLNAYYTETGNPDYFEQDLARYRTVTAADIQAAVVKFLPKDRRVELSVVPEK